MEEMGQLDLMVIMPGMDLKEIEVAMVMAMVMAMEEEMEEAMEEEAEKGLLEELVALEELGEMAQLGQMEILLGTDLKEVMEVAMEREVVEAKEEEAKRVLLAELVESGELEELVELVELVEWVVMGLTTMQPGTDQAVATVATAEAVETVLVMEMVSPVPQAD